MRISDWSSDVCSSDLPVADIDLLEAVQLRPRQVGDIVRIAGIGQLVDGHDRLALRIQPAHQRRSDEAGAAGNDYSHVPFTRLWRGLAGVASCPLYSGGQIGRAHV